ncbi:SMI1/KNR4 family protein [Pseudomonas sp. NA13]
MIDYRGLILEDTREGATDRAIAQLEASLGARLPDDYSQFLKTCNGAYVEYDVLATLANGDEELLSFSLYGLDPDKTYESNPFELEQLRAQPGFPQRDCCRSVATAVRVSCCWIYGKGARMWRRWSRACPPGLGVVSRAMSTWCWRILSMAIWIRCIYRKSGSRSISITS